MWGRGQRAGTSRRGQPKPGREGLTFKAQASGHLPVGFLGLLLRLTSPSSLPTSSRVVSSMTSATARARPHPYHFRRGCAQGRV